MEIINNCPRDCTQCQKVKCNDYGLGQSYECTAGVFEGEKAWFEANKVECDQFDPKFATAKSEHGVARYNLVTKEFWSPWVNYEEKKLTCPNCLGVNWAVETQGIDWGDETCRNCGFSSHFLSYNTHIGDTVQNFTFLLEWQGNNIDTWYDDDDDDMDTSGWQKEGF